ncbi:MAG TPA: bifunctional methylenetetrahydrofolate dehydrogenase/methenyltetrahydrofolate cyclohydrolase FolD [Actinomycetota bacterium]|nr:bifunctional methylenetetrahydrofolate dehydrogenase/methenyltetrahydrofolate cyclohydrolase FolD [Actinomycetota bacterium]
MTARVIDGKAIAAQVRAEVADRVRALAERRVTPGLAAVLVGEDPASRTYVGAKQKACAEVGIRSERLDLPAAVSQEDLLAEIHRLNEDPTVHGILVQLPLPAHIDVTAVHEAIAPEKDVDGLTPRSVGRMVRGEPLFLPATPFGIVELLDRSGIPIEGAEVVIVGRGALVGMPLAIMLAQKAPRANATVTLCHTGTRDLAAHTRRAEILVVAAGRPRTVTADMVRPGATVVDVGTNRLEDGRLVGDVDFEGVSKVAGAITPVPGGVGPMTVAMLLVNTVTAAERAARAAASAAAPRPAGG